MLLWHKYCRSDAGRTWCLPDMSPSRTRTRSVQAAKSRFLFFVTSLMSGLWHGLKVDLQIIRNRDTFFTFIMLKC